MPELPAARLARFQTEYGLPEYDAEVLTSDKALADYFEAAVQEFPRPKQVSNWIMSESLRDWNRDWSGITYWQITPTALGQLLALVENGTISGKIAKTVFEDMKATGRMPEAIVKEKGLTQISDTAALESLAQEIINANPKEAADYRARQDQGPGLFRGPTDETNQGPGQPAAGQ